MSKVSYYTEEGLKKLRQELNQLKDIERPKASQAIAEARDKGDLSENAEYDAAKEAQGMLEMQIAKLENTLANARIINESELDTSKVLVLSTVEVKNKSNGAKMKYTLVAQSEADLKTSYPLDNYVLDYINDNYNTSRHNVEIIDVYVYNKEIKFSL